MPKVTTVNVGSISTPPSPPAGVMKGWELTTTNIGLTPHGLVGSSLPVYSGPSTIPAGTTISERRITTPINVSAGNITIEKCLINPTTRLSEAIVYATYPQGNITIRDCEIDGSNLPEVVREGAYGFQGGGNLYRNYIHDVGIGIGMMSSTNTRDFGDIPNTITVENNYVHDLFHYSDAHHEAGTVRDFVMGTGNTRLMTWRGNWLEADSLFVSGGLFLQATWEDIHNLTVVDNMLAGEGWNMDLMESPGSTVYSNVRAINNRFLPGTREYYGPANTQNGVGFAEWTENYMYDATAADNRGAFVPAP